MTGESKFRGVIGDYDTGSAIEKICSSIIEKIKPAYTLVTKETINVHSNRYEN